MTVDKERFIDGININTPAGEKKLREKKYKYTETEAKPVNHTSVPKTTKHDKHM